MTDREVFRRSRLTLAPCWGLAASLALTVLWAASHFDLRLAWDVLLPAVLPLAWAACRTAKWAARTWTATADGRMIVRAGVLFRSQEEIPLQATVRAHVQPCLPGRWLDVGHLSLELAGPGGQPLAVRWHWLSRANRLAEILSARGQVPLGRRSRWHRLGAQVQALCRAHRPRQAQRGAGGSEEGSSPSGEEYQRFLGFCRLLLEGKGATPWPPAGVSRAAAQRWMVVLRQARIVVDAPADGGWRLAASVQRLDDVRRRIGEKELRRALQRPV